MTRPRRGLLRLLVAATLPLAAWLSVTAPSLGAAPRQPGPDADPVATSGSADIASVSAWVPSDGEFVVRFGLGAELPDGAELTWTIHQSLVGSRSDSVRSQVRRIIDGGPTGRILQSSVTVPTSELVDDGSGPTLVIPIRSQRSSSDRVLLPNPGVHPVDLVMTAVDGTVLWSDVVFLNRLPDPGRDGTDPASDPLRVTLLVPVESPVGIAPDGSSVLAEPSRTELAQVGALLAATPGAPLLIGARPNTIESVALVDDSWSRRLLAQLSVTAGSDESPSTQLMARPYVGVDAGGLVEAGGSDELVRQFSVGDTAVAQITGRSPVHHTYALDDTVDPGAIETLRDLGTGSVLLPASRLDLEAAGIDEADAVSRPMELADSGGVGALAYDDDLSELLARPGAAPGLRSHQSTTVLMSSWFAAREGGVARRSAAAIVIAPGTDPAVIDALTPALTTDGGPLNADPSREALAEPTTESPAISVALAPRDAPDQRPALFAALESRDQLDAYRSMGGWADPSLSVWDDLNDESLAAALDPAERETLHATVRTGIAGNLAGIELPRSRRVLVTSQAQSIPLRFRNGMPFDVTLVMRARSPRLDIAGGETREIVLSPGENRIDLPVEVQAPGESLLRIEFTSPDPGLTLPESAIPVRSTAVSGVGAALSIISVIFLAGWWLHTHRRSRRQDAEQAAAEQDPAEPPRPDPDATDADPSATGPETAVATTTVDDGG